MVASTDESAGNLQRYQATLDGEPPQPAPDRHVTVLNRIVDSAVSVVPAGGCSIACSIIVGLL